jgi:carbon-monoxide dehydrogenase medium subunit
MKAAKFEYARPLDIPAVIRALGTDGAKVLGGGQSLGPMLNLRLARPDVLIDIARLTDLRAVTETADGVRYGAAITHAEIEDGVMADPTGGILAKIASGIAYRAVRNRGTIGGSLAHADPAADWPTTLMAIVASVTTSGPRGDRTIPVEAFILGAFETDLAPDEIIVSVFVPRLSPSARWGYVKSCRKVGEFAESMCAVLNDPDRGICRLVIGATEAKQIVVADARQALADPSNLDPLLEAAGLADDPATFELHRATIRAAINEARP